MYNMDISIFGYKINVEMLILIGIIYLIMIINTACGCYRKNKFFEGMDVPEITQLPNGDFTDKGIESSANTNPSNLPTQVPAGSQDKEDKTKKVPEAFLNKEGFTGANLNGGQSSSYDLENETYMDVSKWSSPDLSVTSCKQNSKGTKEILNRPEQKLPLPEGEMFFFETTQFKPECCPNTYSTSSGCACMTTGQYNYLVTRSGNNVPYSEY